jgi:hypothetical protein
MGIVNLKPVVYNVSDGTNTTTNEDMYHLGMISDAKILEETLMRMHERILNSDQRPDFNIEGATEAIVMRSVCSAMSRVRYRIKDKYKAIEEEV